MIDGQLCKFLIWQNWGYSEDKSITEIRNYYPPGPESKGIRAIQ